jgi:hypothetical protein
VAIAMSGHARGIGLAALLALVAVATLTAAGCGGKEPSRDQTIERYGDKLREAVSSNVTDEPRQAQMLAIVAQLEELQLRFSKEMGEFIDSYRKLNTDYEAPRAAFEQLFADYGAKRLSARSAALDLHFQLAALATASEWDRIGKAETKLYEAVSTARPALDGAK